MPKFNLKPQFLRAASIGRPVGVDREKRIIHGYVVAQKGPFKSEGRGEFDDQSLDKIFQLMMGNESTGGTKSRFAHPNESDDGLGKFLGRARNPSWHKAEGKVRADLHLDPSSRETPSGDLGNYIMTLAESDPDALSSSLVLRVKQEARLNPDGTRMMGADGKPLPPLWRPEKIHASDIVDTGDAVDGLLSAGVDVDALPLAALWRGAELLDSVFAGQPVEVVRERCSAWLERYLSSKFGESPIVAPNLDMLQRRQRLRERQAS